jgi:hypothetical protein
MKILDNIGEKNVKIKAANRVWKKLNNALFLMASTASFKSCVFLVFEMFS